MAQTSAMAGQAPTIQVSSDGSKPKWERETDQVRLDFRAKQILYGKNTRGYDIYSSTVPKRERKGYTEHPRTPDMHEAQSTRNWAGKIKAWRLALHKFDPPEDADDLALAAFLKDSTKIVDPNPIPIIGTGVGVTTTASAFPFPAQQGLFAPVPSLLGATAPAQVQPEVQPTTAVATTVQQQGDDGDDDDDDDVL